MNFFIILQILLFLIYYFHFWTSWITSSFTIVLFYASRAHFHDEVFDLKVGATCGLVLLQWFCYALLGHGILTKIGMTYLHADIVKEGHENILNSFEEGVIIIDEHTKEIQFVNNAAKTLISPKIWLSTLNSQSNTRSLDNEMYLIDW